MSTKDSGVKSHCPFFKPSAQSPWICAKWIRPIVVVKKGWQSGPPPEPFCTVEDKCPSLGLRLIPRADQESDSEE